MPMENGFADPYNGVAAAWSALVAYQHRRRTGRGQHVDCSQQETLMQMVGPLFMDFSMNGRVALPVGNRHPLAYDAPHGVFPCRGEDRWISLVVDREEEGTTLRTLNLGGNDIGEIGAARQGDRPG